MLSAHWSMHIFCCMFCSNVLEKCQLRLSRLKDIIYNYVFPLNLFGEWNVVCWYYPTKEKYIKTSKSKLLWNIKMFILVIGRRKFSDPYLLFGLLSNHIFDDITIILIIFYSSCLHNSIMIFSTNSRFPFPC